MATPPNPPEVGGSQLGHPSDPAILESVRDHWAYIQPRSPVYNLFFSELTIVAAVHGRIVARVPVKAVHVNSKKTLHGAVSAALVDWSGGMAIASAGHSSTGVSVDIHISYVSAAREGDELEVEAWVQRVGQITRLHQHGDSGTAEGDNRRRHVTSP